MTPYLRLTDREWRAIEPYLPPNKSGPRRKNDRATVTAFLFAQAAGVSLDCLPDCGFPNPLSLRTTMQRWRARGELDAVLQAGQPALPLSADWIPRVRQEPPHEPGGRCKRGYRYSHRMTLRVQLAPLEIDRAAAKQFTTPSECIRRSLLQALRADGVDPERLATATLLAK
jgi:transposase